MRDLILIALIAVAVVATLRRPLWGGLAWIFVSISSIHQFGYVTATLPVAMVIGLSLLLSILAHRSEFHFAWSKPLIWLALFTLWMNVTYLASFQLDENYPMWERVMKINLFMFVVSGVILTRKDVDLVIWALVLALGILGVKGGLFTIAKGGAYLVWGPGGFIGGNNEFALALIMIIPLIYYLRFVCEQRWIKNALLAMMFLCAISAIGSHSRGALLAIAAMSASMVIKSKHRGTLSFVTIVTIVLVLVIMPVEWSDRMKSIESYEQDISAMGRINAWTMAFNLALDRFFGSSFENVKFEYFLQYGLSTETALMQGPHSIFFQVLGQHGFVGLFLFLGMGISVWRCAGRVVRSSDGNTGQDARDVMLGQMTKASIVAFAVGGAFLGLAYFDMPYYLMLAIGKLDQLIAKKQQVQPSRDAVTP